jgi:hypothetical protein
VISGVVSVGEADGRYGVVFVSGGFDVDEDATPARREAIRRERRATATHQGGAR